MSITFVDVSSYLVFLYGGPGGNAGAVAAISLGIPNANALLRFYPEAVVLPQNSTVMDVNGRPIFYTSYRASQLHATVDILRNERPLKFFFRDDTLVSYLTTAYEPVGEGEA